MIKRSITVLSSLSVLVITTGSALAIELTQPSDATPTNSVSFQSGVAQPTQQPNSICDEKPGLPGC